MLLHTMWIGFTKWGWNLKFHNMKISRSSLATSIAITKAAGTSPAGQAKTGQTTFISALGWVIVINYQSYGKGR